MRRFLCLAIGTIAGLVWADYTGATAVRPPVEAGQTYNRPIKESGSLPGVSGPVEGWSYIGLSFFDELSLPNEKFDIRGLRLNLPMGAHHGVTGLDIGIFSNTVVQDAAGISLAGGWTHLGYDSVGLFGAALFNYAEGHVRGVQLALGYNTVQKTFKGVQIAAINNSLEACGLQLGAVTLMVKGRGCQVGLFNYAEELSGLQIGLFNVVEFAPLPYRPILSFSF